MSTSRERTQQTIVAPSTPMGRAAVCLLRLSGPDALPIAAKVFVGVQSVEKQSARRAELGDFLDRKGRAIDRGLLTVFRGPASYTGEDVVEMTTHGSVAVVRELVAACVQAGARVADPGEFTLRAMRSGKLDLTQAEAVRDLVDAATVEQARIATRQLQGEVSDTFAPLAEKVLHVLADLEASLDFADEEDLALAPQHFADRCRGLADEIQALLHDSETAKRVREGARVVFLGPPNAGKSSLFNALVGESRAIVTSEPGTTRDLVEETIVLDGLPLVLIDAAGIGEAGGEAERQGMQRAVRAARDADLVLELFDPATQDQPQNTSQFARRIVVATHADATRATSAIDAGRSSMRESTVLVDSVTGRGMDDLRARMAQELHAPGSVPIESVALATERHRDAAASARSLLIQSAESLESGTEIELVAIELRQAVAQLHSILGEVGPEELLGQIFSRFCIGK